MLSYYCTELLVYGDLGLGSCVEGYWSAGRDVYDFDDLDDLDDLMVWMAWHPW